MLRQNGTDGQVAAVAFGAPPGLVWKPLAGPETFEDVEDGYLVAPADVALWRPAAERPFRASGTVEAIAIAPAAEAPMVRVEAAVAHAGRGLEGDRYFENRGTFSNPHATGNDLTLIEAEVLDALTLPEGGYLEPADARRNVITRGVDLNALVGRNFGVGTAVCVGRRLCEPCAHLQRLTRPGVLRALVHVGGLRADVVTDGVIRVGDPVAPA
jgi:MOSC domain-containing protein YiiM